MKIHEIINSHLCLTPVTESALSQRTLLTEQELYEGFLDSATKFLGNQKDKTIADIKGSITDMASAAILLKDIVQYPKTLDMVRNQLGKFNRQFIKHIEYAASQKPAIKTLWDKIKSTVMTLRNTQGLGGFFSNLGLYGFLKYIFANINTDLKKEVVDVIFRKITELGNLIPRIALGPFLELFNALVQVKKYFLDILTYIRTKLLAGSALIGKTSYNK